MLRQSHFTFAFFSFLLDSGCWGDINKTDNTSRGGKDFQDTGLGICHSHGMLPKNNIQFKDIVKVDNDDDYVEETYYDSDGIFYDDYLVAAKEGKIVRPPKEVELTIYWTRMVSRPNCVDRLNITLGSKISMVFSDPSDALV